MTELELRGALAAKEDESAQDKMQFREALKMLAMQGEQVRMQGEVIRRLMSERAPVSVPFLKVPKEGVEPLDLTARRSRLSALRGRFNSRPEAARAAA